MRATPYAVHRYQDRWSIWAYGSPFFVCEDYRHALDVAVAAAASASMGSGLIVEAGTRGSALVRKGVPLKDRLESSAT